MFCYNCGRQIANTMRFCPTCGAPVKQSAPQVVQPKPVQPVYIPVKLVVQQPITPTQQVPTPVKVQPVQPPQKPAPVVEIVEEKVEPIKQPDPTPTPVQEILKPQSKKQPEPKEVKEEKPVIKTEPYKKAKKSISKAPIVIISIILCIALIVGGLFLYDLYVLNPTSELEDRLMERTWYTEPTYWVSDGGETNTAVAYTIEFNSKEAIITTYMYSCPSYEKILSYKLQIYKRETVEWKIDSNRILHFNGEEYKFTTVLKGEEDYWYFTDDGVVIDQTYYNEDTWFYEK